MIDPSRNLDLSSDAMPTPLPTAPESGAPHWETIEEEILCPLCDYNLRGLIKPRCPECGYPFVWQDVLDPTRRLHPYLFEHHPGRRIWSFWRTLTASLRPRRFWKMLHPAQPSSPKRLILYWVLAVLPMLLTVVANVGGLAVAVRRENQIARTFEKAYLTSPKIAPLMQSTLQPYGSVDKYLDTIYPVDWAGVFRVMRTYGTVIPLFFPAGIALAWPWLTMLALLLFQISMRRARVRRAHVLRCICYSSDIGFWLGLAIAPAALMFAFYQPIRMPGAFLRVLPYELFGCVTAMLVFSYRLMIAYRSYLRFRRSVWVILAAQIIGFLLLLNLFVLFAVLNEGR